MIKIYLYLVLLLFILALYLRGFVINIKCAPIKVKVFSSLCIFFILLRYFGLILFFILQSMNYIYLLKPLIFCNLAIIPLIYILCAYIFMRNDKMKFHYNFILMALSGIAYIVIMIKIPMFIQISNTFGYIAILSKQGYISYGYLIIISVIMCFIITMLNRANINKKGMWILLISIIVAILEIIFSVFGLKIFMDSLISEFLCAIALNYALSTFKKGRG